MRDSSLDANATLLPQKCSLVSILINSLISAFREKCEIKKKVKANPKITRLILKNKDCHQEKKKKKKNICIPEHVGI